MSTVILDNLSRSARTSDVEEFFHGFGRIRDINIKSDHAVICFDDHRDAEDACKRLDGRRLCEERVRVTQERGGSRNDDRRNDRFDNRDRRDDRGGRGGYDDRDRRDDRFDRRDDRGYGGGRGRSRSPPRRDTYRDRRSPPRRTRGRVERTKFGIICKNLSTRTTWMDLKDLGRKYGDITYSDANKIADREGLITFATRKDMMNAYDSLKGLDFMGRDLEVEYEFPETVDEDWRGEVNNDHPKSGGGPPRGGRASRSPSNDRFRDRSRSRSYSR